MLISHLIGLIIVSAHYGRAANFTARGMKEDEKEGSSDMVIDVTIPVQALVQDSKLYIPGSRAKVRLTQVALRNEGLHPP